jgi:hypothetical protein
LFWGLCDAVLGCWSGLGWIGLGLTGGDEHVHVHGLRSRSAMYLYVYTYRWRRWMIGVDSTRTFLVEFIAYFLMVFAE